jgi:uncharacterized protein
MEYGLLEQPRACTIDLTEACNLACDYCFTHSDHRPKHLSINKGKRIIDWWLPQTNQKEEVAISWWGGEPLLRWKQLKELTKYAQEKAKIYERNLIFGGTTNGTLYTPDKVEWCLLNRSLMLVSLDGLEEQHDAHRCYKNGKGSWKKVIKNIKAAQEVAPQTKIRMSIHADHVHTLLESIQFVFEDLGMEDLAFSPVIESNWTPEKFEILKDQFDQVVAYQIKRMKKGYQTRIKHFNDGVFVRDGVPFNPCGAGRFYMGWSVDGYAFPCHRFNKHGRTPEQQGKDPACIVRPRPGTSNFEWINKPFIDNFDFVKESPDQCTECEIWRHSHCNGNCYAVNWDLTRDIRKIDKKSCTFNKLQHDAAMMLKEQAEKENIELTSTNWTGENPSQENSCICYNMCYQEGTGYERIHTNMGTDQTCICYNMKYSGDLEPENTRILQQRIQQRATRNKFLKLCKRIIETNHLEKTDEQKKLEQEVLNKTIEMLGEKNAK